MNSGSVSDDTSGSCSSSRSYSFDSDRQQVETARRQSRTTLTNRSGREVEMYSDIQILGGEDIQVVESDSYSNAHAYNINPAMQNPFSDAYSNPSESLTEWTASHRWEHSRQAPYIDEDNTTRGVEQETYPQHIQTQMENEAEIFHNPFGLSQTIMPSSNEKTGINPEEEPVTVEVEVEVHDRSEKVSNRSPIQEEIDAGAAGNVTVERMKYERPQDPRNLIINVIINSANGSVTLQSIHNALQWDKQFEAANGSVLDYLQGYQSIFAVSPIDDRVTLRRPLQTAKGRRTVRGQRGYYAISSRIGSISCSYVATAFDLDTLSAIYKRRGYETEFIYGVLHVSSHRVFDLFLFSNGVVVWWGLNRPDHWLVDDDFLSSSHSYVREALKERHQQKIIDEMFPFWCSYELDEQYDSSTPSRKEEALKRFATHLCFDHYLIPDVAPIRTQIMLTVSYSLGRTAVVDFFDCVTQTLHKEVLAIPSNIKGLRDYVSTRRRIAHLEGELQLARMIIIAVRDSPEFLWEMAWLDDYYSLVERQNASGQLLLWFMSKSDALLQQLRNIKTRRFRLFMLGSDVFLILLLITDVFFIMLTFVLKLYFPLDDEETHLQ